jgi:hypothetical protein
MKKRPRHLYVLAAAPRRKKRKPEKSVGFAVSMGITIFIGVLPFLGGAWLLLKRKPPPPPEPPEPVVIYREAPAPPPPPKVEPVKVEMKAEPPKPPPPPPPVKVPEPPPSPWTGVWRSDKAKASLRLSVSKDGVRGFYSPPNGMYAPGDIEQAALAGDTLSFSVVLGTSRFGMRVERSGDQMTVYKWVDIDGLRDEYRKVEILFAQGKINAYQALAARQQIQAVLKTAGPEREKILGAFVREDAPQMRTKR